MRLSRPSILILAVCFGIRCIASASEVSQSATERLELRVNNPWSVAAMNFRDDDGGLIAAVSHSDNYLAVWSVDKLRKTEALAKAEVGFHPDHVSWVDWDRDGNPHELLVTVEGLSRVQIWKYGERKLTKLQEIPVTDPPRTAKITDFDADGNLDLVLGPYTGDRLTTLWNDGNSFTQGFISAGQWPSYPAIADWNRDGRPDIVWSAWQEGCVSVALNQGKREFDVRELRPAGPGSPRQVTAGDVDGDGYPDLVVPLEVGGGALIVYNDTHGEAKQTEMIAAPVAGFSSAAVDDPVDVSMLALSAAGIEILARKISDEWQLKQFEVPAIAADPQFADVDGDNELDLIFANSGGKSADIIFGPLWDKAQPLQADEMR